ncbi:hypothetical protein JRO89_XS13G0023200 [Xanthoceras sorbifolium]|uniref:Beta-glucosidase n=1 Tax=Xanthoceras sorbifolium TaxID=99658 RepID=A0ABQ8H638_9ROSI|nr:hypothetical protein JRO89_XS13G0023200 [Xanthoceras sorbifolium]
MKMRVPILHLLFLLPLSVTVIQSVVDATEFDEAVEPETVHFDTGGLSRKAFPKGFVFGTATSAYQVEGMAHKDGRGPSIWDSFVKIPGNYFISQLLSFIYVTVDQYHRYKEDVDIMANLNFDAYRFSISWSRIFPYGTGKVNWKGVAYYNRLINYLLKRGITPYANLYHYDLPEALEKKYMGLLSDKVVFIHPIVYGEYPKTMQNIVGNRLPKFTEEQVKMVKGSMDFVGINQYTSYYMYEPHLKKPKYLGYQQDWNAGFAYAKHGIPIGARAYSYWLYNVPWGMYKALTYIKERYGNPTVILSENGMDDPAIDPRQINKNDSLGRVSAAFLLL